MNRTSPKAMVCLVNEPSQRVDPLQVGQDVPEVDGLNSLLFQLYFGFNFEPVPQLEAKGLTK